jgi:hypothetical protein
MKNLFLLTILLIGGLFASCSGNESGDEATQTPVIPKPSAITISTISNEFVIAGDVLEITGTNFTNKNYPTKILINGKEVAHKELSDTKIQLLITDNFSDGVNTIILQIEKISSNYVQFYFMPKGWNKLNFFGDKDVLTSCAFDESKTIFSFIDDDISTNVFDGTPKKLEGKFTGYKDIALNLSGSYGYFKMLNDKTGVITHTFGGYFTDNCFETKKQFSADPTNFSSGINDLKIGYLDSKYSIVTTSISGQLYTTDNGATIVKNDPPIWSQNRYSTRLGISAFGKSTSNNKFYQLGILYDPDLYGSNYKNVVLESETGYSNWVVKDTVSDSNKNLSPHEYKFLNINKIFTISSVDKTLQESDDMLKTWKTVKTDVRSIFLRSETQWYIQSGNKIYVTTDAGLTWNLELDLPVGSIVNEISFSKSKIIVSGNKGLLYLKLE